METIMCIHWKSNSLGCAYYSSHSLEMFLMEDIKETNEFEYTTLCKEVTKKSSSIICLK